MNEYEMERAMFDGTGRNSREAERRAQLLAGLRPRLVRWVSAMQTGAEPESELSRHAGGRG
jgi:hypothetical protein